MPVSSAKLREVREAMVPAGYMCKRISARPDWWDCVDHVVDVFSVSGCISPAFADYTSDWRHNNFWFFDDLSIIREIAHKENVDIGAMTFFYYEVYAEEYDEKAATWSAFELKIDLPTNVVAPSGKKLAGYDVVTFQSGTTPECSPLSCNNLCRKIRVNEHCLLDTFEQAKRAVGNGEFAHSEPGPYRIFAVYTIG